eukprot:gene11019-13632_t
MAAIKEPPLVLGVLSGISYVSGIDYYKGINEGYAALVGKKHLMPPNPLMVMVSVDCDVYAKMLVAREWEGVSQHLLKGIDRLVLAGCNMICIASNTGHIVYPAITSKYPDVSVLHIADATAAAIKAKGLDTVGLLGTEPTMRERYLRDRLQHHGITTLIPEKDEDLNQ